METTNLDHPNDDELIAELRDLTNRIEGLLDRVRTNGFPPVDEFELSDFSYPSTFVDESAGFLN